MNLKNLEFEGGRLVKVDSMRPEYMSGQRLIELVRELAKALSEAKVSLADLYVAEHTSAEACQCLEWSDDAQRWQFIAHGARYAPDEAKALAGRYAERGIKVRLMPC